jgi:hypothetical protein
LSKWYQRTWNIQSVKWLGPLWRVRICAGSLIHIFFTTLSARFCGLVWSSAWSNSVAWSFAYKPHIFQNSVMCNHRDNFNMGTADCACVVIDHVVVISWSSGAVTITSDTLMAIFFNMHSGKVDTTNIREDAEEWDGTRCSTVTIRVLRSYAMLKYKDFFSRVCTTVLICWGTFLFSMYIREDECEGFAPSRNML